MENILKAIELLGEKNVQKLRDGLTEMLLDFIREDLDNMGDYILDFDDLFGEVREEAYTKVKDKLATEYSEVIEKSLRNALRGTGQICGGENI